jgi:predicted phosphodiesterase
MRIRVLSDLHLEFRNWHPPQVEADVVVLAGDIQVGAGGPHWARREFPDTPIIYVPGNHEYYGGKLQDVLAALRAEGERSWVHMLEKDARIARKA